MNEQQAGGRLPSLGEVGAVMVGFIAIMFLFINVFGLPIQLALFTSARLIHEAGLKTKMASGFLL